MQWIQKPALSPPPRALLCSHKFSGEMKVQCVYISTLENTFHRSNEIQWRQQYFSFFSFPCSQRGTAVVTMNRRCEKTMHFKDNIIACHCVSLWWKTRAESAVGKSHWWHCSFSFLRLDSVSAGCTSSAPCGNSPSQTLHGADFQAAPPLHLYALRLFPLFSTPLSPFCPSDLVIDCCT